MNDKTTYSQLSENGKLLVDFLEKQIWKSYSGSLAELGAACSLPVEHLQTAVRELRHYDLLRMEGNTEKINEVCLFTLEAVLSLPQGVSNAEPFIIDLQNYWISSLSLTPDAYKVLCYVWLINEKEKSMPSFEQILSAFPIVTKPLTQALMATVNHLIEQELLMDYNGKYALSSGCKKGVLFEDYAPFQLKAKVFKIYSLIYLLAEDKDCVYAERKTLSKLSGFRPDNVTYALDVLKAQGYIEKIPFPAKLIGQRVVYRLLQKSEKVHIKC